MLVEKKIVLSNASGTGYKTWENEIQVSLIERIGPEEVTVQSNMTPKEALSLWKSLGNSLIEAKVRRGKKQY